MSSDMTNLVSRRLNTQSIVTTKVLESISRVEKDQLLTLEMTRYLKIKFLQEVKVRAIRLIDFIRLGPWAVI